MLNKIPDIFDVLDILQQYVPASLAQWFEKGPQEYLTDGDKSLDICLGSGHGKDKILAVAIFTLLGEEMKTSLSKVIFNLDRPEAGSSLAHRKKRD
jgi:hypothetical protein